MFEKYDVIIIIVSGFPVGQTAEEVGKIKGILCTVCNMKKINNADSHEISLRAFGIKTRAKSHLFYFSF